MTAKQIMKAVSQRKTNDEVHDVDTTTRLQTEAAERYALLQEAQELYKEKIEEFREARKAYNAASASYSKIWQQKMENDVLGE